MEEEVGDGVLGRGDRASGFMNVLMRAPASVMLVSERDLEREDTSMLLCSIINMDSIQFFSISDGTILPHTMMLNWSIPSSGRRTPVCSESFDVVPGSLRSRNMVMSLMYSQHASSNFVMMVLVSNSTIQLQKHLDVLDITG